AGDAVKPALALVHESALLRVELVPRPRRIEARALGRLQQLALVPLARGMRPRLPPAAAEAERAVGHDERLVVLEDVTEALALAAGAERMVEREEQRLRPLERGAARAAAK